MWKKHRFWHRFFGFLAPNLSPKSGPQIQKINFFRYLGPAWANLGPKGAPRRPKTAKTRAKDATRAPKWGLQAPQKSHNEAKRRAKKGKMRQKGTIQPAHYQPKSHKACLHQTSDTSNWWPTVPNIKREWPPTRNRWHTKLVTHCSWI